MTNEAVQATSLKLHRNRAHALLAAELQGHLDFFFGHSLSQRIQQEAERREIEARVLVAKLVEAALAPRDAAQASAPHGSEEASRIVAAVVSAFVAGHTEEQVAWAKQLTEAAPDHPIGWRYLAAGYAELDRTEEAQAAMQQYLRVTPHHSTEILRVTSLAQLPGLKERLIASLRKAGLPESG
jgi:hypothetical protein